MCFRELLEEWQAKKSQALEQHLQLVTMSLDEQLEAVHSQVGPSSTTANYYISVSVDCKENVQ